ncbi:MAG: cytochrome c-type biogenesis protein [Dehalococcoidia bacterium]
MPKLTLIGAAFLLAVVASLSVPSVLTHAQEYEELPEELEARAQGLYVNIMCPQCSGQTIQQSHAPIAVTMREIIRERLLRGDTDQAITAFLVEAYGEGVLASPPKRGFGTIVWVVPPVALLLGALAVYLTVRGMKQPPPAQAVSGLVAQPDGADLAPYLELVDTEMESGGAPPPNEGESERHG